MYVSISCSHVGKTINNADKARRVFSQSKLGLRPNPLAWGSVWGLSALFYWSATLISNNRASLNICLSHPPPSLKLVKVSEGRSERHGVVRVSRGCLWVPLVLQCCETRADRVFPVQQLDLTTIFSTLWKHWVIQFVKRFVFMVGWLKCCLVSSDVSWHIRDKLWPMPKHGSINLYVHGNQKAR